MNESIAEKKIINASLELERISNESIEQYGFKHKVKTGSLEETYRTEIRRQRDKILYTGGFRRLQDKTQVMSATLTGDHRTRLTHTLEVEQIAISVADALGLNKDLVSAIALGHDVGHTPFGHAAERTLNSKLKDNGGFHHPIQSAKYLWEKYGNNLIDEIYEGILAHDSDMFTIDTDKVQKQLGYSEYSEAEDQNTIKNCIWIIKFLNAVPSTLEAQTVIWADKIAYITHDLEDFLHSPIYTSVIKAEQSGYDKTKKQLLEILNILINPKKIDSIEVFRSRDLIRAITTNLIETSAKNISSIHNLLQTSVKEETNKRLDENQKDKKKRYLNSLIINFEDDFRNLYYDLRKLLDEKYIFSSEVQRSDAKAQNIISFLYNQFTENYRLTPLVIRMKIDKELGKNKEQKYLEKQIIARMVASYISTMSDTYAENMFCNLNGSKDNYSI